MSKETGVRGMDWFFRIVQCACLLFLWTTSLNAEGVTKKEAILPSHNELALKLMDCEALYTISEGIKPVSEGFWSADLSSTSNSESLISEARFALGRLPLGVKHETGILVFHDQDGKQTQATAYVAYVRAVESLVKTRPDVFGQRAPNQAICVQQVLESAEQARGEMRWRAFGLLFGYPEHAVEFFVEADRLRGTGQEVYPRDFFQIPTYASETGRFVFAVPKGHVPTQEDIKLRERCKLVLSQYRHLRDRISCEPSLSGSVIMAHWVQCSSSCVLNRYPTPGNEPYRDSVSAKYQANSLVVETE